LNSTTNGGWLSVASSADGTKLVTVGNSGTYNGPIYVSADSGTTWTPSIAPSLDWASVASSTDGVKLVALAYHTAYDSGAIYTSTNSGATWTLTPVPSVAWSAVASSADGTKLIAGSEWDNSAMGTLRLYTSIDSGATWQWAVSPATHWPAVASSADGSKLVAAAGPYLFPSGIYTWQSTPELGLARSGTNLVVSWPTLSSATGCVCQQNLDLTTTNWVNMTDGPTVTNGLYQMTMSPSNSQGFYRLKCSR
jgi:hypothetical protein